MAAGIFSEALCGITLVLALILATHPFVTYPLSLGLLPRKRYSAKARGKGGIRALHRPAVAICLCAFNEEDVIVDKLNSLLRMAELYGPATIHVYSDGSTDRTNALLEGFATRADIVISPHRLGKTHGMNILANRSQSELVMFTDANVVMPEDALIQLTQPFNDPACGCTTARLVYVNRHETATALIGALYWAIEEFIKGIESSCGFVMGVDGASFVVRRTCYHQPPDDLIDDLYVTLRVLLDGMRVVRVSSVAVYERGAVDAKEEYQRKVRIACQAMRVHCRLWPRLRRMPVHLLYAYLSHRLMKWMSPYCYLIACLAAFALLGMQTSGAVAMLTLGIGAALLIAGQVFRIPGVSLISNAVVALAGVASGVLKGMLSQQAFVIWNPAASVRKGTQERAGYCAEIDPLSCTARPSGCTRISRIATSRATTISTPENSITPLQRACVHAKPPAEPSTLDPM